MVDLLIRRAKIVDGTGNPWFIGDVGVAGDTVVEVGKLATPAVEDYKQVIDADGLILSPGFIDMHSHSDLMQMANPLASTKIRQGITTELLGQDGLGVAPMSPEAAVGYRQYLTGLLGNPTVDWTWRSFADYLKALETARTATNLAVLVSHGPLRLLAVGMDERTATAEELAKMKSMAAEALDQGAFGFSTGLIYPPCVFADQLELVALAQATAQAGGIFVVHIRNERDLAEKSLQEIFELGRLTGVYPHISHLKVMGKENWGLAPRLLSLFEEARSQGLEAGFDQYPYPAGSTMLSILIPPHAHAGGPEALLARLKDLEMRQVLSRQMMDGLPGWENIASAAGWEGVIVTGIPEGRNKHWEGTSLARMAELKGCTPQEVVFDLLVEEQLQVSMVNFSMHESDVKEIIGHSLGMLGTDGLLGGKPHPRAYGSTARILQKYVREDRVLSLEQAVARMTSRSAARLGLFNRGVIRPGMKADLVLFDPEGIQDRASYTDPCQHPAGFEYVWVNGMAALAKGQETGNLSGRVLRKNR